MKVFGPVPSRRLGQSLGINNIPPKVCSYSCVYCQLGRTNKMQSRRGIFYRPEDLLNETGIRIKELKTKQEKLDYITFVADGEPTLDENLGAEIDLLKQFGVKVAVITNASLLWLDRVKEDLSKADWVSLKIDATDEASWHKIDRPHRYLKLQEILRGILDFAGNYQGTLVTETMLVKGYNDSRECVEGLGSYLRKLQPAKAYLLVPTRPPAENVQRPAYERLKEIYNSIRDLAQVEVECVTGEEGESFFLSEDLIRDLLSILAVHPVAEEVIIKLLKDRNMEKAALQELLKQGILEEYTFQNKKFYMRRIGKRSIAPEPE